MKKRLLILSMLGAMCMASLVGCGNKPKDMKDLTERMEEAIDEELDFTTITMTGDLSCDLDYSKCDSDDLTDEELDLLREMSFDLSDSFEMVAAHYDDDSYYFSVANTDLKGGSLVDTLAAAFEASGSDNELEDDVLDFAYDLIDWLDGFELEMYSPDGEDLYIKSGSIFANDDIYYIESKQAETAADLVGGGDSDVTDIKENATEDASKIQKSEEFLDFIEEFGESDFKTSKIGGQDCYTITIDVDGDVVEYLLEYAEDNEDDLSDSTIDDIEKLEEYKEAFDNKDVKATMEIYVNAKTYHFVGGAVNVKVDNFDDMEDAGIEGVEGSFKFNLSIILSDEKHEFSKKQMNNATDLIELFEDMDLDYSVLSDEDALADALSEVFNEDFVNLAVTVFTFVSKMSMMY